MVAMFDKVKRWFHFNGARAALPEQFEKLRKRAPVPLFWLFGKTQSGKTSIIKFLTGADDAEIGQGFTPCTRYSREYQFPTAAAPVLSFLDTRGVDEPGYDPAEDLARFNDRAHVVIVTVKALDHAQENLLRHLRSIRRAKPSRPVVLALTCLHEAYPQEQHLQPYPFRMEAEAGTRSDNESRSLPLSPCPLVPPSGSGAAIPEALARSLAEQCRRFEGLIDAAVPIDLTRPEEGFREVHYGGDALKQVLIGVLPHAYRQTLLTLDEVSRELQDFYARRVLPHIVGYSTLAATAGALPIPWVDLLILPSIQTHMIYDLAQVYGQPLSARRFLELASTSGLGLLLRQAAREVVKFIPYVGSLAGGALAATSTFALGKAFCYYYSSVNQGHMPRTEELRQHYQEELAQAAHAWKVSKDASRNHGAGSPQPGHPDIGLSSGHG